MEGHPFYPPGPPAVHGGFSGSGLGGFADFVKDRESRNIHGQGFSQERDLLSILPNLDTIQQIKLDIALHRDAINSGNFRQYNNLLASDSRWKEKLIDVFQGKEKDPQIISNLIGILNRDIASHKGRPSNKITGSNRWNITWINIYKQWLEKLKKIGDEYDS